MVVRTGVFAPAEHAPPHAWRPDESARQCASAVNTARVPSAEGTIPKPWSLRLHGLGVGLGIVICMLQVLISMYFEQYRGAANGIMFAGSTASAVIFPHLLYYFRNTYGFRGSLLLFGAILMNMIAVSLAFREPPWVRNDRIKRRKGAEKTQRPSTFTPDSNQGSKVSTTKVVLLNLRGVLKCRMTYVLVVTWLVFCYNYDIFFSTIVDFAMDKGVPFKDTVSFITYTSITDLVGRLALPILTDRGLLQRSTLMTVNYFLLGLCTVSLPFCETYWALLTGCLGVALFLGCAITMQSVLVAQYLESEKLAMGFNVIGALCGPALLGKAPFVDPAPPAPILDDAIYCVWQQGTATFGATGGGFKSHPDLGGFGHDSASAMTNSRKLLLQVGYLPGSSCVKTSDYYLFKVSCPVELLDLLN
ncbi:hypothetical protein HPB49_026286 [Dermacentor silvarum]|nr:hypothetical protein HPB49_026286 [Dermacentor silvarum]